MRSLQSTCVLQSQQWGYRNEYPVNHGSLVRDFHKLLTEICFLADVQAYLSDELAYPHLPIA